MNKLVAGLKTILDNAENIGINRGKTQSFVLADEKLPLKEGAQFLKAQIDRLCAE